jgi:hypothetical protein
VAPAAGEASTAEFRAAEPPVVTVPDPYAFADDAGYPAASAYDPAPEMSAIPLSSVGVSERTEVSVPAASSLGVSQRTEITVPAASGAPVSSGASAASGAPISSSASAASSAPISGGASAGPPSELPRRPRGGQHAARHGKPSRWRGGTPKPAASPPAATQSPAATGADLGVSEPDRTLEHSGFFTGDDNGDGPAQWLTDPTPDSQRPPWELGDGS